MIRATTRTQLEHSERILCGCVPHRDGRNIKQHESLTTEENPRKPQFGWRVPEWKVFRAGHQNRKQTALITLA
jgi:hypothetical protein